MQISIIIPVYKVEPYIIRCVDSVLRQTYRELEVVLVDDCTPDCSMDMAREYIEQSPLSKDLTFLYLHHDHNRGLSAARNTGVGAATGDYLYFLDSDDEITENCIELLVTALDGGKVEIVCGGFKPNNDNSVWKNWHQAYFFYNENKDIRYAYTNNHIYPMAWNKMIKKLFVLKDQLYFKEGIIHEDELWSFRLALITSSMALSTISHTR